jgi:plastocyanin
MPVLTPHRLMRHGFGFPFAIAVVVLAALVIVGCSSSSSTTTAAPATAPAGGYVGTSPAAGGGSATTTAPAAGGTAVTISGFAFSPASVTVKVGDTVTWTNKDSVPHNVTAADGSFNSGSLAQGASFSFTFQKAGTYTYRCTIHPSMAPATVIVQ